jgi:hypothetical protein
MLSSKRGRDVEHRPCQDRSMSRASMTPCHALQLEVSLAETLPLPCPWRRRELDCQGRRRLGGGGKPRRRLLERAQRNVWKYLANHNGPQANM